MTQKSMETGGRMARKKAEDTRVEAQQRQYAFRS